MVTRIDWRRAVAGLVLAAGAAGCRELVVVNSNAPERERAFSDPAVIVASAGGTLKTYFNMRNDYDPPLVLTSVARSFQASWNNFNMRYYNSYGNGGGANCVDRCAWGQQHRDPVGRPGPTVLVWLLLGTLLGQRRALCAPGSGR